MRKAICHYSFHRRWKDENWDCNRLAREVADLGVEGVDFHVRYLGQPGPEAARTIRQAVKDHGLVLSGLSMSNDFSGQGDAWRKQVDAVKAWLPVAAEVEAPVSRIFGGHIPEAYRFVAEHREAAGKRVLEGLAEVVREAERLGVVLALENHGGLPCTGEEQVAMIEAINSRHLRATIDVGNYLQGGQEGKDGTATAAGLAAYVHFKDFKKVPYGLNPWGYAGEACVVGEGDIDHAECLKALRAAGYDGFVALEYEGTEAEVTGVPRSVDFMNKVME